MDNEGKVKFAGEWYDLGDFPKQHPGGQSFIDLFSGRDVTHAFRSYHPHFPDSRIHSVLKKSKMDSKDATYAEDKLGKGYQELQKEVMKALGGFRNSKGTPGFFLKSFVIVSAALCLEAMQWMYGFKLYRAVLLGCTFALIGLNIQHDANHGAASLNSKVNYSLGLLQDWIGGSAIHWRHHHVVLHHIHTNTEGDPDIRAKPLLRIHPKDEPDSMNRFQHLYIWPVLSLLGVRIILLEPFDLLTGAFGENDSSKVGDTEQRFANATKQDRQIALFLRALFYLRFIILPIIFNPEWNTALCIYVAIAAGSFYLGALFIVSHNFNDVKHHISNGNDARQSFMGTQVETSCNWGGTLAVYLCGGLNYQIEHHLFPGICHMHYPKIAPIVRRKCKELGLTYVHYPSFLSNAQSCFSHLRKMGFGKLHEF